MERSRLRSSAREVAIVAVLYAAYSVIRNLLGNDERLAERNARRLVDLERTLGIFHERSIQRAFDHGWLMEMLNTFYGLAHFVVTAVVLIWLFRGRGASYGRWRTALTTTTFLALVGYVLFPLMPPRLLPDLGIFDALSVHGSPWNYEEGAISELSNPYAAMPSLHVAWALWCSIAIWIEAAGSRARRVTLRTLAIAYSLAALVSVIATGNHYLLDAVGGALVLAIGLAIGFGIGRRPARRSEAVVPAVDGDDVGRVVAAGAAGEVDRDAPEVVR